MQSYRFYLTVADLNMRLVFMHHSCSKVVELRASRRSPEYRATAMPAIIGYINHIDAIRAANHARPNRRRRTTTPGRA